MYAWEDADVVAVAQVILPLKWRATDEPRLLHPAATMEEQVQEAMFDGGIVAMALEEHKKPGSFPIRIEGSTNAKSAFIVAQRNTGTSMVCLTDSGSRSLTLQTRSVAELCDVTLPYCA